LWFDELCSAHIKLPEPDLTIVWKRDPADVIDNLAFGRIGPIPLRPYRRPCPPGVHDPPGGPAVVPRSGLPDAHVKDLAPTIVVLLAAALSQQLEGSSLLASLRIPGGYENGRC